MGLFRRKGKKEREKKLLLHRRGASRSDHCALVSSQVLTKACHCERTHMGSLGIHVCHAGLSRMVAMAHMVRNEGPRSCWAVLPSISNPQPNSSVVSGPGTCKDAGLPLSRSHPRILAAKACQEQTHGWPYDRSGTRHRKQDPANESREVPDCRPTISWKVLALGETP